MYALLLKCRQQSFQSTDTVILNKKKTKKKKKQKTENTSENKKPHVNLHFRLARN